MIGDSDQFSTFWISKIKTITKIDDGSNDGRFLNGGIWRACHFQRPATCSCGTSLPEIDAVAQPVVGVITGPENSAIQYHFENTLVAAVVAKNDLGRWQHYRNCFFSFPVFVYMPVMRMSFIE